MTRTLMLADLDGTLLDSSGSFWPEAFQLAEAAAESDCVIALCSARPDWSVRALAEELGPTVGYVASFQGAMVSRRVVSAAVETPGTWQTVRRCVLDSVVYRSIARFVRFGDSVWWYTDSGWYVDSITRAAELEARAVRATWTAVGFKGPDDSLLKILIVRSTDAESLLAQLRSGRLPIECSLSQPGYVEVVSRAAGCDKGASLVRMLVEDGGTRPRTVALGDGRNDLGMFSVANVGVTFDDAASELRTVADLVLSADRRVALRQLSQKLQRNWL